MSEIINKIKLTPLLDTLRLQKISDEEYFSVKYSDYISNSRLGFIDPNNNGSAQKFLDGFGGNRIFSDSLTLGSQVHQNILQSELFELPPDLGRPTAKVGFIADELISMGCDENYSEEQFTKACTIVDYYKGHPSEKKRGEIEPLIKAYINNFRDYKESYTGDKDYMPILDSKNLEKAKECIKALRSNKKVQSLLHPKGLIEDPISECEQAILLDVKVEAQDIPEFTVRLKSKLDNYTIDKEANIITVNDVKTIGRTFVTYDNFGNKIDNLADQVTKYHYYRELYMYSYLLAQCSKKFYGMKNPTVKSNFLWVSTIPTYYTKVTAMTANDFKRGMIEFQELLRMAAITLYYKDAIKAEDYFGTL